MGSKKVLPISVLILTQNEEENIAAALESVIFDFDQVIILDSYSNDKLLKIIGSFPGVEIYQHTFSSWADQRNWMLRNCSIRNEIIFFLDADENVEKSFVNELGQIIEKGMEFSCISLRNRFIFLGRYLRFAYGHPPKRRIFKRLKVVFTSEGAREYDNILVDTIIMKTPLIHHDRYPIARSIHKHNNNSNREAELYFYRKIKEIDNSCKYVFKTRLKLWVRNNIWNKIPLLMRPFIYFLHRFLFGLSFLDGIPGIVYCYLHSFWYHLLIDIKIIEKIHKNKMHAENSETPNKYVLKPLPVSVLIMTQNEEENIEQALNSVANNFDQIIVVDSFSTDKTIEICRKFSNIEIYEHHFESWADQRNWMLANCSIKNEAVFFLDADEFIDERFVNELHSILESSEEFHSIYLDVKYVFLGKIINRAYGHPKIRRIFKKTNLSFVSRGAREYANENGRTITMHSPLIHYDRKPIYNWIEKHNSNSDRESNIFLSMKQENRLAIPVQLKAKMWVRNNIWNKLPLCFRPFLYFIYRYLFLMGILDGREGFIYCFLHAFWYHSLIDIKIVEKMCKIK